MPVRAIDYVVSVDSSNKGIMSLEFNDGFKTPISKLQFETNEAAISWLGKPVTASLTLGSTTDSIFSGYVDEVVYSRLPGAYEINCSNNLRLARDHWLVPDDLESPWSRSNISAEALVGALLAEAGLTNYSGASSSFTFGTNGPAEFSLCSVMDAIDQINNILAYNIYMIDSTVYWQQIFPVPSGTASQTLDNFITINKVTSTTNLRNKVVVFGKDGIRAEASAVSEHLPDGFYATAIVSSQFIDTQSMAQQSADYNLQLYNKLTEELRVDIEGNPTINVRDTVHVTYAPLSIDEDWFVYSVRHYFEETFTTSLVMRK